MKKLVSAVVLLCSTILLWGNGVPDVHVKKIHESITLDGVLDEEVWTQVQPATDFWQYFPSDSLISENRTEVYMLFDDTHLYIGARMYTSGDQYVITSLKRDFRAGGNDNVTFLFDSFNDASNAFVFGMNPLGVRREALITDGGLSHENFFTGWDNKWDGVATIAEDHWEVEMAIPFSTLRFNAGSDKWRFNCYRFDTQTNETMSWAHIPRNQTLTNLAFMGDMYWQEPLKKNGANISLIPYASAAWDKDFEAGTDGNFDSGIGGDAKIGVTPGMNLDLTFNPDFSQVEVDQQVTNLSRFEIFFPERRQFFTENSDLFGGFGSSRINPFFSRRIGIVEDTASEVNISNPIFYGARLSGKLTEDLRVGFLNMMTDDDRANGLPTFNYTVATVQKKLFSRSNVGFIFVNKQALNPDSTDLFDRFNRTIGIDYNLGTADNKWNGKTFIHKVIGVQSKDDEIAHGLRLEYRHLRYRASWSHAYVGENYTPDVGFVPRTDYFRIDPEFTLFFYPESDKINTIQLQVESGMIMTNGFGRSDQDLEVRLTVEYENTSRLNIGAQNRYTYLFEEFDPTNTDATPLPVDSEYSDYTVQASYSTDRRSRLGLRLNGTYGEFFDGTRIGIGGNFSYRVQPYGSISVNYNINRINLRDPHADATLLLIGPRVDLTFSKNIFLSAIAQYNSQIENMNFNARFQWRFKPVSDLFIVYTDNYNTDGFIVKNRTLVAKITYWLNV